MNSILIKLGFKISLITSIISFNSSAQKVLNGDLENYFPYNYNCNLGVQDSSFFTTFIPNVSISYMCNKPIFKSHILSEPLDTCSNRWMSSLIVPYSDTMKHGNAHLFFSMYAQTPNQPCPGNYVLKAINPSYNFKLSSSLHINNIYLIRVDIARYMLTSPLDDTLYISANTQDIRKESAIAEIIEKRLISSNDPNKWKTYVRIIKPDSAYNYLSVRKSNYYHCDCNINWSLNNHMFSTGFYLDNLILDTCVQIGTTQTVSVSPCQSAFPITLQSNRLHGSMYFWSNNDTLPNTVVSDTGKYLSFVYDSIGCAVIDSFVVQYDTTLAIGKKNDVLKCSNASITLLADIGASWYEWNTGATTRVIFVSDTGLYWVKSKKNNCIRIDTFVVKPYAVSSIFTVSQRKVCNLAIATLDATHPQYNRYMWSTGDTTSTITVSQTGIYYVTAIDSICNITDSVQVFILNQTSETIDTGICAQTSITLQARIADSYLWSTGDTTQQLTTQQIGKYFVKRTIQQCELTDTFTVENYPTPSNVSFDSIICKGTSLILQAQSATSYQWNTGQQTPSIAVFDAGIYQVIKTIPPCTGTETFNVSTYPLPQITSVQDTTVCFDEVKQILLDAGQFAKYLWEPTGETTRTIYSNTAQIYKLTVTDSNTCVSSKAFAVMEECPYSLYIPNAFTPNNDGTNDELVIKGNRIDAFEMMIVNRWGQIIYETDRMNQYWDGANCETGVYVIYIKYSAINKNYTYKGTVSLMR